MSNGLIRTSGCLMASMATVYSESSKCRAWADDILRDVNWRPVDRQDAVQVAEAMKRWLLPNLGSYYNDCQARKIEIPAPQVGAVFLAAIALASGNRARLVLWYQNGLPDFKAFVEIWDRKQETWIAVGPEPEPKSTKYIMFLDTIKQTFDLNMPVSD